MQILQVLAAVTRLELEKGFPDRCLNTVLVQHARDMRGASRQLHLATIEAPDVISRPFTVSCLHIDTPAFRQAPAASIYTCRLARRRAPVRLS
jgi:hypothetical protein